MSIRDDNDEFREPRANGWKALDRSLRRVYGEMEPRHWGTYVSWEMGGPDPIRGISAYHATRQRPHWHFTTFGFSELYEKESDNPQVSGFGFELTFRLARSLDEEPPEWVLGFLQNLGRYVFETGRVFGSGHTLPLNGPIALDTETKIRAIAFTLDPELQWTDTPNGQVEFLQIVGLTEDELAQIQLWNSERFLDLARVENELLITDLWRSSLLKDLKFAMAAAEGAKRDGASSTGLSTDQTSFFVREAQCMLVLGAYLVEHVKVRLRGRIPYNRPFSLYAGSTEVRFEPGDNFEFQAAEHGLTIFLSAQHVDCLANLVQPRAGSYQHRALPGLTVVVEKTEIKDRDGNVAEVIG
jgi:suppressor of fused